MYEGGRRQSGGALLVVGLSFALLYTPYAQILVRRANRCWTGATRTSESYPSTHSGEQGLRCSEQDAKVVYVRYCFMVPVARGKTVEAKKPVP